MNWWAVGKTTIKNLQTTSQSADNMDITEKEFASMLDLARRLIREPSPSLGERKVAELVEQEMRRIGYDDVRRDELGNVIGIVEGHSTGPSIMLNGHMDQVEVTDADKWQHGPFEGYRDDEFLYGRGAADMKASLAVMMHCGVLIKRYVPNWSGRVVLAAVVLEETGTGLGIRHTLEKIRPDAAIVGEPTANRLVIAHRGKVELIAVVRGKSCHASMPDKGVNPLFAMAEFIKRVAELEMPGDELLGKDTLVPTIVRTDQPCSNVVPSEIKLYLDWRCGPSQKQEELQAKLNTIIAECLTDGTSGEVTFSKFSGQCYTGKAVSHNSLAACFRIDRQHHVVQIAQNTLNKSLGMELEPTIMSGITDASVLHEKGVPTILFGPGDAGIAHMRDERIELAQMRQAAKGFLCLLDSLSRELKK